LNIKANVPVNKAILPILPGDRFQVALTTILLPHADF